MKYILIDRAKFVYWSSFWTAHSQEHLLVEEGNEVGAPNLVKLVYFCYDHVVDQVSQHVSSLPLLYRCGIIHTVTWPLL